uniref:CABIT domain-containing protein n=1 Tax=Branchiostoma floridae TaxID=7739 RepID=C3YQV5_BRAFL|eukprot:XP_002601284.1 hypothetical protein BRAFLDRAFT_81324 [Branchiostoma floridae]
MAAARRDSVTTLEQFVSEHALPATVEVAEGLYATRLDSDFSIGDVIRVLPARHAHRVRGQPPKVQEVEVVTRNGALRKTLPVDWPIFVRPVSSGEDDFQQAMDLSELCRSPKGTAVRIQKGVRLTIHYDVAARTVLAGDDNTKVAIRESYRGVFEKRPHVYPTVHDLYISEMEGKVRATKTVPVSHPDLDSVFVDDLITPTGKKGRVPCDRQPTGHVEYILCTREQRKENGQFQAEPIRIPLSMVCPFEEILEKHQMSEFTLRELFRNGRPELPIRMALVRGDPKFPDRTLAYMSTITVEGMYDETHVVASEYDNESPDKPVFEIPLHAGLKVIHKVKLYTELDGRVKVKYYPIETLPESIYLAKRALVTAYEDIPVAPPVPPRYREGVRSASLSTPEPESMSPTEKIPPVPKHGSETDKVPPVPRHGLESDKAPPVPRHGSESLPTPAVHGRPRHASLPDDWLSSGASPVQGRRDDSGTSTLGIHTLPLKPKKLHIKKGFKKFIKRVKEGPLSPREHPEPTTATTTGDEETDEAQIPEEASSELGIPGHRERQSVRSSRPSSYTAGDEQEDAGEYEWIDSSDEDDDYLTPVRVSSPSDPAVSLPAQLMKTVLSKQLSHVSEEGGNDSDGSYVTPVTSPTTLQAGEYSSDDGHTQIFPSLFLFLISFPLSLCTPRDAGEYEWIDSSDEDDDYLTPVRVSSPSDPAVSLPAQLMKTVLSKQLSHVSEEGGNDSDGSYVTPVTSPTTLQAGEYSSDDDDGSHDYVEMEEESEFGTVSALKEIPKPAPRHGHRRDKTYRGQGLTRTSTISTTSTDSGFSDPTPSEKTIPPPDYNILDFSTHDMTRLLRYFHFKEDTVHSFHTQAITGLTVLNITSKQMAEEFHMDDLQIKMLSHFVEKMKEVNRLSLARSTGSEC